MRPSPWAALAAGLAAGAALRAPAELDPAGHVALVTGGCRGLGLNLVIEMAERGAHTAFCDRSAQDVEETEQRLRRQGLEVRGFVCDVSRREDVHALVARVTREMGPVTLLLNNAGIIKVAPLEALTEHDFQECLNTDFWGLLNTCLEVLPGMIGRGTGRILNITSVSGRIPVPRLLAYSCAKAAAVALSEGMSLELARRGIGVTTVLPGLMRTGSHLNARFKGEAAGEYAWFSRAAVHPALAADARRAARRFVQAMLRGEREVLFGWESSLGTRFHALLPGLSMRLSSLVDRLLPPHSPNQEEQLSRTLRPEKPLGPLLRRLEKQAVERYQRGWGGATAK